jgi:hypothetical protein
MEIELKTSNLGFGGGDLHDRLLAPSKPKNIVTSVCIYILVMEMG